MIKKSLIAASLIGVAVPTIASAAPAQTFERDGVSYTYSTETKDGRTVITGSANKGGSPFRLVVADGKVRGRFGDTPVSFPITAVSPAAASTVAVR